MPLDIEECRTAVWLAKGNVTTAAKLLKIPSSRLRTFIAKSPYLTTELEESREQLLDAAESQIADALVDVDDTARADSAAKFVIQQLGHRRGYGGKTPGGITIGKPGAGSSVTITWDDGSELAEVEQPSGMRVIDHE